MGFGSSTRALPGAGESSGRPAPFPGHGWPVGDGGLMNVKEVACAQRQGSPTAHRVRRGAAGRLRVRARLRTEPSAPEALRNARRPEPPRLGFLLSV